MRKGFWGKPEGERAFGRPTRQWEDNIEVGLEETKWEHELA